MHGPFHSGSQGKQVSPDMRFADTLSLVESWDQKTSTRLSQGFPSIFTLVYPEGVTSSGSKGSRRPSWQEERHVLLCIIL
eukprot:1138822-Pelagomonas_calceolata.AAC.2